jgi:hypothetical protein
VLRYKQPALRDITQGGNSMRTRFAVVAAAIAAASAAAGALLGGAGSSKATLGCPAGYVQEADSGRACVAQKHPEKPIELILREAGARSPRSAPYYGVNPDAYANALAQWQALVANKPQVKGVAGTWKLVGHGPLKADGADYTNVNGLGLHDLSARLDSLAYDAAHDRLFAAEGTGGIWMSTDRGATWRSIGDTLPSQVVGGVGWTSANGGTVIAVSGDPSFGTNGYTGYGAFWSTDLGATWNKATGIPNGALAFAIQADPSSPSKVYAATSFGLYRSTDGGKSYVNTNLPTGSCAGVVGGTCQLANVVTDVRVITPGGVGTSAPAGTVVAIVGWRASDRANSDGTVQSASNGVYRSTSGDPGTFQRMAAPGFPAAHRIGRTELGSAVGAQQDHDYLYAIVQDAAALNGELDVIDVPAPDIKDKAQAAGGTVLNGIYVSSDFGQTWTQMADDNAIAKNPATGSALTGLNSAQGYEPGVQSWYDEWIAPDPTRQDAAGVPTRLAFGLEEVWQNELDTAMNGKTTFKVIGRYFSDKACMGLNLGLPACPTQRQPMNGSTTHPDQQAGIWLPDGSGGVTLAVGNDGGFYRQSVAAGAELDNGGWGNGSQTGLDTLLPYDAAMANDGTVWAGLQDNGELKITPDGTWYETYGGDGGMTEVNPFDSNTAYEEYVYAAIKVTTDGGKSWRSIDPKLTSARFVTPFQMDPANANHLVVGGNEIKETIYGADTNGPDANTGQCFATCWQQVFDLGTHDHPGDPVAAPPAADPTSDPNNTTSAIDTYGDATYVGYCGVCDILNAKVPFKSGIATNVGGAVPGAKMTPNGWHIAAAKGLPNRFITSVKIDPNNIRTVYVTLGGYGRRWVPPGSLQDKSSEVGDGHLFKSTDAGATFTDISGNLPDVPAMSVALRGKQLVVGTDVGVFATDVKGGKTFAPLAGLPVVPISTVNLKPNDPNVLVVATYGRGVWTYTFATPLANPPAVASPLCTNATGIPPAPAGTAVAGPYDFDLSDGGWTASSSNPALNLWKRAAPGDGSALSWQTIPYNGAATASVTTSVVSPTINWTGGWLYVDFADRLDTEPGFDYLFVDWSCDGGGTWSTVPWVWDTAAGTWSGTKSFTGQNVSFPLFDKEKAAFNAPAGPVNVRFRFAADDLMGTPPYTGAAIDNVTVSR